MDLDPNERVDIRGNRERYCPTSSGLTMRAMDRQRRDSYGNRPGWWDTRPATQKMIASAKEAIDVVQEYIAESTR